MRRLGHKHFSVEKSRDPDSARQPPSFKPLLKIIKFLCRREDLNLHPLRDAILSRARIPIPPLRHEIHLVF